MAANPPTRQHYVPQCYLGEWADMDSLTSDEPFVWIFDRDGKNKRRDKVRNVLLSKDLYTLKIEGKKVYSIEETLADLEGKYADIFQSKIRHKLPLSEEEHIILCAFVSVMMQRTLRVKDNLEQFYDQMIMMTESLEKMHEVSDTKSTELRNARASAHKMGVVENMPDITELLIRMNVAFLCAQSGSKFITSDDPCNLFNPDLQGQRFWGAGLKQANVQLTLPLSPEIMLCLSWSPLSGYLLWKKSKVEDANRLVRAYSYRYFVVDGPFTKRTWFRKYPLSLFFLITMLERKGKQLVPRLKYSLRRLYDRQK